MLPKRLENFAHKLKFKHASTVLGLSITIQTLVNLVDAEIITSEIYCTLDLSLEFCEVTSEQEFQKLPSQIYDPNPEIMIRQTTDPIVKEEPQCQNYCIFCLKPRHSVSNCFCKQRGVEERNWSSYYRSK